MYSAASELDIMQDINSNGSLITKFSRTNRANNGTVNVRGISKHGKAFVKQTVQNNTGKTYQKDYILPENRILELLTQADTHTLMGNLGKDDANIKMIITKHKKTPKKSVVKRKKSAKKKTPKKSVVKRKKKTPKKSVIKRKKSIKKILKKDIKKLKKNIKEL